MNSRRLFQSLSSELLEALVLADQCEPITVDEFRSLRTRGLVHGTHERPRTTPRGELVLWHRNERGEIAR